MESCGYGVFSRPVCSVGILMWVEAGREAGFDVMLDQPLKALCDYKCEGYWAIVLEAVYGGLLFRNRDDCG